MLHAGDEVGSETGPPAATPRWAGTTFAVLFAMNLLDYLDRNVLMSMQPQIKGEFHISNEQWGLLASIFLVSYSVVSPAMGWLGDRYRRTWLLGLGVGVWSVATIGSGLARNFGHLALARSVLGVGEATYGVIAPTLLLDLFARHQRARLLSAFYLAMPLGSALGLKLGAYVATRYDWHMAFFVAGVPSLLAALVALVLPEPVRGASEKVSVDRLRAHERAGATREDYLDLMVNASYTYSVFGMAAYTFAIGGMLVWVPNYLFNTRHFDQDRATSILSLVTFVAAILGMSIGGWLADRLARSRPQALFVVPGVAMLGSIPFVLAALFATRGRVIFAAIFAAETLMFINTGPCNAIIANVVQPNLRAAAYALAIFALHFLGDIWSPWMIGKAADMFGDPVMMASGVGRALQSLGAVPTRVSDHPPENIVAGLLIVVPALLLSGIVLLAGTRHLPREMALMQVKLRAAPPTKACP
ncbi:MAG: MFS transporter [Planctomycetaceae bacterium]|nr:MFS transporter [Planctomycetaceae bacterium]